MTKLPKQFIELNSIVKAFNTGNNVKLLGEGYYLLLQGSRVKGYSIYIVDANSGNRISKVLLVNSNKRGVIECMETCERLIQPHTKPEYLSINS